MKPRIGVVFGALVLIIALSAVVFGQSIRTNGTGGGAWSSTATWTGGVVPSGSDSVIIASGDSLMFDVPVSISGILINRSAKRDTSGASGSLTIANGGVYQHDVDGGNIPPTTWATGSTYLLTGLATSKPGNGNQNFYNVTVNLGTAYVSAKDLGWANNTIGGNLRIINTNSTQLRLTSPSANQTPTPSTITVNGDLLVDSSTALVGLNGSSTADTMYFYIHGNIVSKGTISMGGSGLANNWYVQGNITLLGGAFSTNSSGLADTLIFNGTTKQTFVSYLATMNYVRSLVRTGATVDLDTFQLGSHSAQGFVVEPGGTVITARAQGLVGNINTTAAKILSKSASYTYDGTVAQSDTLLPDTVKNLTIDNPAGFVMYRATVVTGVLTLKAGVVNNDNPNSITIASGGSVVFAGGSTTSPIPGWPATAVEPVKNNHPGTFALDQNYPNPFNPTTVIGYQLPKSGNVTVTVYGILGNKVRSLVNGVQSAGYHSVVFNAENLASGMYFYKIQAGNFTQTKKMVLLK